MDNELDSLTYKMKHEFGFTDLDIYKIGPVLKILKGKALFFIKYSYYFI